MTKKEKLVDLLRQDARLSNEQLAVMLDTSADDVAAMIAELEKSGMIIGYTAIINEEEFDRNSVCAFIEVRVSPEIQCGYDDVAAVVAQYDEVSSVYLMSGGYDLAVTIKGTNLRDVAMFVTDRLALFAVMSLSPTPKVSILASCIIRSRIRYSSSEFDATILQH